MSVLKDVGTLLGHTDTVWCVNWSFDGRTLASCSSDKTVRVYNVRPGDGQDGAVKVGEPTVIKFGHERTVRSVCFSPCGRYMLTGSFDSTAIVWLKTDDDWEIHTTLEGHENEVKCGAWSVSGQFLATCSRDKSVWVWEVDEEEDVECCSILQTHTQDVKAVVFHPVDHMFVSCSYDNGMRMYRYDMDDWIVTQSIDDAHKSTVWQAAFHPSGRLLATCSHDAIVKIWRNTAAADAIIESADKWVCFCRIQVGDADDPWPVYSVDWCADASVCVLACACADGSVRLYRGTPTLTGWLQSLTLSGGSSPGPAPVDLPNNPDALSFDLLHVQPDAHVSDCNSVRWNPKQPTLLASAGDDGVVKLWTVDLSA